MPTTHRRMPQTCHAIQSLWFKKDLWTRTKVRNWLKRHGFRYDAIEVPTSKTSHYIHARQYDPPSKKLAKTTSFWFSVEKGILAKYNIRYDCKHKSLQNKQKKKTPKKNK